MKKVLIYVEGPSDKYAMTSLLDPLINEKLQAGIQITFLEAPTGDKKKSVIMKVPEKTKQAAGSNSPPRCQVY